MVKQLRFGRGRAPMTDDAVKARLAAMEALIKASGDWPTWDLIAPIAPQPDGRMLGLHGEFKDWPQKVRDAILGRMALQCDCRRGHELKIVASGCFQDVPWEPAYIRVVVQEFPEKVN